jgi:hypothetical protein
VYDRNKDGEGFLGMLDIKPVLKDGYCLDNWYKLATRGTEHVTGELWVQIIYTAIRVSLLFNSSAKTLTTRTKRISSHPISNSSNSSDEVLLVESSKSERRILDVSMP